MTKSFHMQHKNQVIEQCLYSQGINIMETDDRNSEWAHKKELISQL